MPTIARLMVADQQQEYCALIMSDNAERLRKRANNLCQLAAYEINTARRAELIQQAAKLNLDAQAVEAITSS